MHEMRMKHLAWWSSGLEEDLMTWFVALAGVVAVISDEVVKFGLVGLGDLVGRVAWLVW